MTRHYRRIPKDTVRIPVPDTTQQTDYSCGASSLQAVCKHFGVGPDDEWEYVDALGMDRRVGSHPDQIQRAAARYGLRFKEYLPMSIAQLRAELGKRHPVLLMIQAYGLRERQLPILDYRNDWKDGHWVVAIGFDSRAIFFEDPSLQAVRGYLRDEELDQRWHDTARHGKHMDHYGLALWHPRIHRSRYASRAERIP
jgi:uncharacterized protein